MVSEWTFLEQDLIMLFQYALYAHLPGTAEAIDVSQDAWDAMESIKARTDFLASVLERRIPEQLCAHFAKEIAPAIRKRALERNRVVHGQWCTSEAFPDDLILIYKKEKLARYTVKDFDDIAARIQTLGTTIKAFWLHVREQISPQAQA